MDDALPLLWLNGKRQYSPGPHISAHDRGFTLADGVFETMRAHGGTIFRLDRHLARLAQGLALLHIPVQSDLRDWVLNAVRAGGCHDASVRVTVTRGAGVAGVAPPEHSRPTVVVAVRPFPVFPVEVYKAGLNAHVASGRRNERAITTGLKTLAYTEAVAALIEAQHAGAQEALFLDTEEHCSEATSSNLFVWTDSTLMTPPISCAALPGITRATVLELAASLGVSAAERAFGLDELLGADEAFLTSSLRGLAPLVRVGAHPIGQSAPGTLTRQLAEAYRALVARECERQ